MKRLALIGLILLGFSVASLTLVSTPQLVSAASKDDVCAGLGEVGGDCNASAAGGVTVEGTVQAAIRIVSWIVGIISVIMIIVGGAKYVMSGGDSSGIQSAKNTIMYALIGIVIVALAQVIAKFAIDKAT